MADRTVTLVIGANIAGLTAKLRKATTDVKDFTGKVDQHVQKNRVAWGEMSTGLGLAGVAGVAAFAMIVKGAAEFDKSMSKVKASGKDAAANIGALRAAAVKAGADTQYSAADAASAITDLAKAGVSASSILGGGLAGALSLAAAGEMDVKQAAEVTATALAQFKLEGSQASHVADLLAAGAGKAMGEVSDMGAALAQGGLVAHQTGLSLEETTGALAAFAQQGLIGSDAGTSLKTMLQRLTPTSKEAAAQFDKLKISAYDSQGQFVGLANFAGQLKDKMSGLTPEARNAAMAVMFGSDAVRGASVLYEEGASGIDKWVKAVNDQGFASRQAAILTDNLSGDLERLGGSIDTVFIQSGTGASQAMRGLTQSAGAAVNAFGELPGPLLSVVGLLAGAGGVGVLGVAGVMKVAGAASDAHRAFKDLTGSAGRAKLAIGGVGAALAVGTIALSMWLDAQATAKANSDDFASTLVVVDGKVLSTASTLTEMNSKLAETATLMGWGPSLMDLMEQVGVSADDAQGYLAGEADAIGRVQAAMDAYVKSNPLAGATPVTMLQQGLDALGGSLTNAKRVTLQKARADEQAAISTGTYSDALAKQSTAAAGATTSLEDYAKSLFASANAALQLSGTQIGFESALDATAAAIEKTGKAHRLANGELDLNTKKGQDNQTQLNNLATSSNAYSQKLITQGASEETVQKHMERSRKAFIKQAVAAGMTSAAAKRVADEYGLIPENTQANIKTKLDRTGINAWNMWHPADHFAKVNVKWGSLPKTLKIGSQGTMRVGFAGGGPVWGAGTATSDSIDAKLSNGEHVIPTDEVNMAGGQDAIHRWRASIRAGAKFATGGAVEPSYYGQPLSYWAGQVKTPLELTRLQVQIRDLKHDLAEKETYNPPGKKKKAKRDKLRGLDRTASTQELAEARVELDLADKAGKVNGSAAGTIAQQIAAFEASTAAAEAATEAATAVAEARATAATAAATATNDKISKFQSVAESSANQLNKFDLGAAGASSLTAHSDLNGNAWYTENAATGAGIAGKAKARAAAIKGFSTKLGQLQKAGLAAVVLQEIAGLGSEEGGRVADALLADRASIGTTNEAYAEMATYSAQAGTFVSGVMDGLDSNMDAVGTALAKAFAGALGVTSLPGRALGGPVSAGELYQVNEQGLEMFRPNVNGFILTAGQTAAAGVGQGSTLAVFSDAQIQTLARSVVAAASTITANQAAADAQSMRYANGSF